MWKCPYCFSELEDIGDFCPYCGRSATSLVLIYISQKYIDIMLFDRSGSVLHHRRERTYLDLYDRSEHGYRVSLRNLVHWVFEYVHRKRPSKVYLYSHYRDFVREFTLLAHFPVIELSEGDLDRCVEYVRSREWPSARYIAVSDVNPVDKISGSHTTIIGGSKALELLLKIAELPFVKRIVPGRIEAKGSKGRGGVRVRITRVDDRGNIKLVIAHGSAKQDIYVVTSASNPSEALEFVKEIEEIVSSSDTT
ncbi:MAG: hypothetical protein DRJ40_02000 [Thermoprotei archaeon]|nr:MAG: hypothetical protein DRJ40_02000 [Thermoprotei archaeon]